MNEFIAQSEDESYSENKKSVKNILQSKSKKRMKQGEGKEAKRVFERLNGFDQKKSIACQKIEEKFGTGIVHGELKDIAVFISQVGQIIIDRDAKRDNRVLHKWFDENWEKIEPILDRITCR